MNRLFVLLLKEIARINLNRILFQTHYLVIINKSTMDQLQNICSDSIIHLSLQN